MSYKQKPIKEDPLPLTPLILKKQAAYDRRGLEYVKTSEDYKEMEFYDAVSRRPNTHQKFVTSIYRLKTNKTFVVGAESDEALVYHMQETVQNHSDQYLQIEKVYGVWWDVDTRMNKNLQGQPAKVQVLKEIPVFEIPFTPENVDKIIAGSLIDVNQFYVATASNAGPNVTSGDIYTIKNIEDFKQGTFQELMDMGRYNYSTIEPRLAMWKAEGDTIKKQSQTITSLTGGKPSRNS